MNQPLMRAVVTQDVLNRLDDQQRADLRDRAPESYDKVVNSSPFEYIPLAVDMRLAQELWFLYGAEACQSMTRKGTLETLSHPVLRPIVAGGLKWFGRSPYALLKAYSVTVSATMKNVGKFKAVRVSDTSMDLEWTDVPDLVFDNTVWVDTFVASFESVFDYLGVQGHGLAKFLNRTAQCMTLSFEWKPARE